MGDLLSLKQESVEKLEEIQSKKVSVMTGKQIPKTVTSSEFEIPIRKGAYVISVEGESFIGWGNKRYEAIGFLGRLVGLERHLDGYMLYFTYGNEGWDERGERLGNPKHTIHPLCEEGFFVPEDGLKILDYGDVILVSRNGLFSGEGYSELVKKYRERYLKIYQMYFEIKNKYEEVIGQNQALSEELNILKASREDWLYYSVELTSKYHLVYDAYKRFKGEYDGLVAMLDKMVDVDSGLREAIKYELATIDKRVVDVLNLFENFKLEESIRSEGMNLPKITPEMREYYKRKLTSKTSLGKLKEMDTEIETKEKQVEQMQDNMKKIYSYAKQLEEKVKQLEEENKRLKENRQKIPEEEEESQEEGESEEGEGEAEEGEAEEGEEESKEEGNIVRKILHRGGK